MWISVAVTPGVDPLDPLDPLPVETALDPAADEDELPPDPDDLLLLHAAAVMSTAAVTARALFIDATSAP